MEEEITPEQKKEFVIEALVIAGFEENSEFPGMYAQESNDIRCVVDMTAGISEYLYDVSNKCKIDDDPAGILISVKKIIAEAKDGQMPAQTEPDMQYSKDAAPAHMPESTGDVPKITKSVDSKQDGKEPVVSTKRHQPPAQQVELTIDIVKKYINEKVTDEEAYSFIQLCKAKHLNPFIGQVHLIKKEFTGTAKTVVGKDVFMETATRHPQYNGFEAGIIFKAKGKQTTEDRPGAFLDDDETLVGGWAKVHRKDQKYCTEARVSMKEYNTSKASWKRIPATMIRKVPLVQAQREAFAAELSGMYDSSELGVDIE